MKKKSSYSEENFLSANPKLAEYLRQNPRLPKKMKSVKSKHFSPKICTVGHVSCGGNNDFSSIPFGLSKADPLRQEQMLQDESPWSKLHRTFSNRQTSRNFSHGANYLSTEKSHCGGNVRVLEESTTVNPAKAVTHLHNALTRKTSDAAVQVDIPHCIQCRRHLEFGKDFKQYHSSNETDSETNQQVDNHRSSGSSATEQKENRSELLADAVEDDRNKYEKNSFQHLISPSNCASTYGKTTQLSECTCENNSLSEGEDPSKQSNGSSVQFARSSKSIIRNQFHTLVKILIVAVVVISLILYFTPVVVTNIQFYINYVLGRTEVDEQSSFLGWIFHLIFGVQGHKKSCPLLLYWF